ncbi:MAG: GYD domain-containing protein [Nitrospiraceae bacterium]
MKYVMLGRLSADWATKHAQRTRSARAKLKELGIKLESVYYTQGRFDFVDVVDAPDPESMLAFSVWYANQGYGRIQTMPAFDNKTLQKAVQTATKGAST